jgi:hypothetical protein
MPHEDHPSVLRGAGTVAQCTPRCRSRTRVKLFSCLLHQQAKWQPILIYMTNAIPKGCCMSTVFIILLYRIFKFKDNSKFFYINYCDVSAVSFTF